MGILIFSLISYILLSVSLFFLFLKAGEEGWKGLVPFLNFMTWEKIIGNKPTKAFWLLFPIVNIFHFAGMCVDMVRSFGKHGFADAALSVIYSPAAFFRLAFGKEDKYEGPILEKEQEYKQALAAAEENGNEYELKKLKANNPFHKSQPREWAEAIIFAVFAAAFIRMFLIEAYMIPTSSMEGSLLVGDYLFVSKAHYGIRTPQTVAMFPLLHNRMPFVNAESYLESPSLPYYRMPAIENIDNNDPVVFNYPEGDSVYVFPERTYSVYDFKRNSVPANRAIQIRSKKAPLVTRPIDKMDHYIKRCIGIAGDSLQIIDRQVYINGKPLKNATKIQFSYIVDTGGAELSKKKLFDWDVEVAQPIGQGKYYMVLNDEQKNKIQATGASVKIEHAKMEELRPGQKVYPYNHVSANWTVDNYGPIYIPKRGATTPLTMDNIAFYKRIISVYEKNKLEIKNGKFFINGEQTDSYTFKQDYYWMMGDNRHNSEDSRFWGYVPETHIVGKPLFIWFSTKDGNMRNGINWSRIFTSAYKM